MNYLSLAIEKLDIYNSFFRENEVAINFLLEHGILLRETECRKCSTDDRSQKMKICVCRSGSNGRNYRCPNKSCWAKLSLKHGTKFSNFGIPFHKLLRVFYCWVYNFTKYQAIGHCKISENSYIKIKDLILLTVGEEEIEVNQIGGENIRVQFDETAICKCKIIIPSNSHDDLSEIQWIVRGVVEGNCREFFLELVLNRQSATLLQVFQKYVRRGSICITDGYHSYP
ncbi:hypothetical protein DMUE_2655 [Dictyocoela muelleri]|nr:hypothetical protein DMUE_2655 [Dictyocoela muelleri]